MLSNVLPLGAMQAPRNERPTPGAPVTDEAWRHLIHRRCGLAFRETQVPAVLEILNREMASRGMADSAAYYRLLNEEPDGGPEWTAIVEQLLNHETSFFRHQPSYDALRNDVLPFVVATRPRGSRINFLSAGCSTGQEAYSLAMVAMDHDEIRGNFVVWGGDLSRQAIEVARRGRYGPRAAASVPADLRDRYLRRTGPDRSGTGDYEIVEMLRQRVRFLTMNLVSPATVSLSYDVIFCHNVLIYFSPLAASLVVAELASHLRPDGCLLLGPGEGPAERPRGLEPLPIAGVRAFRRRPHHDSEGGQ